MSSLCAEHYRSLLAAHYTWMAGGDYGAIVADNQALLTRLGLPTGGRALDLGCGSGFQTAALLALGYEVTAIDLCEELLEELRARNPAVQRLHLCAGDLLDNSLFRAGAPYDAVVCMGDTLTHLASAPDVERMIAQSGAVLRPGGPLVLRFRDLTAELTGPDRFLPVRSDAQKIMTCFLEYTSPEHVTVTDLIHSRIHDGWRLEKSSYPKLRIAASAVAAMLSENGFDLAHESVERGLVTLVGQKS